MCIRMAVCAQSVRVDYSLIVCILGKHYQTKKKVKALL